MSMGSMSNLEARVDFYGFFPKRIHECRVDESG